MSDRRMSSSRGKLLLLLIAALALAPGLVSAQPGPGGGHPHGGMAPEMHLQRVLSTLNLTADQQAAIDKLMSAQRDAAQTGMQAMMTARKALVTQIHADPMDESAIRQAAAGVAALEADHAVAQATFLGQVRAVLTADQRTQLQQALSQHLAWMEKAAP